MVGEPKRVYSSFVRGIESLPVRISVSELNSPDLAAAINAKGFSGAAGFRILAISRGTPNSR